MLCPGTSSPILLHVTLSSIRNRHANLFCFQKAKLFLLLGNVLLLFFILPETPSWNFHGKTLFIAQLLNEWCLNVTSPGILSWPHQEMVFLRSATVLAFCLAFFSVFDNIQLIYSLMSIFWNCFPHQNIEEPCLSYLHSIWQIIGTHIFAEWMPSVVHEKEDAY